MLRIAVVDDEQEQRVLLENCLHRYEQENSQHFDISLFADAQKFLRQDPGEFDIVLLDIQMPGLDGMTVAHQLRQRNRQLVLIFITNMAQFAIKGYAVDALDYVLKPVPYFAFSQQIQKAVNRLQKRRKTFLTVPLEGGLRRIDVAGIYYLESEGHRVRFYTETGDLATPGTLKAFEEKLAGKPFVRCNSGYLINLAQVMGVQQNTVQVGPYELQISRPRKKAFLEALADYIGSDGL